MLLFFFSLLASLQPVGIPEHKSISWKEKGEWVNAVEVPLSTTPHSSQNNVQYLLLDFQTHLEKQETYSHYAYKILDDVGIEGYGQIEISFDPNYETVMLHQVEIHPGTERVIQSPINKAILLDRETSLEKNIFDGRLTLVLFLQDLRVGDVIEVSYTLKGFNPILHNHYTHGWELGYPSQVEKISHRLIRDKNHKIWFRSHLTDVKIEENVLPDGLFENIVQLTPSLVFPFEKDAPVWHDNQPWIEISDFSSWNDVIEWGKELFSASNEGLSPTIKELVSTWKVHLLADKEKILKALRFVQDEIRYLGFEMGIHGFKPRSPEDVLSSRYGDCKDKSLLLKILLQEMGIESNPCLVNTRLQHKISDSLPNYAAFNHAILSVKLDGKTYWLDATRKCQGGDLEQNSQNFYQYGLELNSKDDGLAFISPKKEENTISIKSSYYIEDENAPARLEVLTVYRGEEANGFRGTLAHLGKNKMSENYRNYYSKKFKKITADNRPIEIEDNRGHNEIIMKEAYIVEGIFDETGTFNLPSPLLGDLLSREIALERTTPLAIYHPFKMQEKAIISLPKLEVKKHEEKEKILHRVFQFSSEVESSSSHEINVFYEYESLDDHVKVEELESFRDQLNKAGNSLSFSFSTQEDADVSSSFSYRYFVLAGIVGVLALVAFFRIKRKIKAWL